MLLLPYIQICVAGLFISLSGSLPLGTLNVAAMQIAAKENYASALQFAIGVTIVEVAYLAITFMVINKLAIQQSLLFVFTVVSIVLLLVMAAGSFIAVAKQKEVNVLLDNNLNRLLLGASMSLFNPLQVPFWVGWIVYLLSQSVFKGATTEYVLFTTSAGIGTFVALLIFIFAGKKFSGLMERNKRLINSVTGTLFVVLAIVQIIKLL